MEKEKQTMTTTTLKDLTPNIMVEDVNASVEFYTNTLGFTLAMSVPDAGKFDWAMITRNSVTFMFQQKESILKEYPMLSSKNVGGALTFFIEITNIDDFYKELKNSVHLVKELGTTPYGMKEFAIKDINGFILTFAER